MMSGRTLKDLREGEQGWVKGIATRGSMRRRLRDLGLVEQTRVECLFKSPSGDPAAYLIRGAVIALRAADAEEIEIEDSKE